VAPFTLLSRPGRRRPAALDCTRRRSWVRRPRAIW